MKRKKYAEELEARLSDEEVKVIVKAKKTNTAASKQPALQLFVVSSCFYNSILAMRSSLKSCRVQCTVKVFSLLINLRIILRSF